MLALCATAAAAAEQQESARGFVFRADGPLVVGPDEQVDVAFVVNGDADETEVFLPPRTHASTP